MEQLDEYIGSKITLQTPKGPVLVKIIYHQLDSTGLLIVSHHDTPQLDSRIYNIHFTDGHYEQYSTNI